MGEACRRDEGCVIIVEKRACLSSTRARALWSGAVSMPVATEVDPLASWIGIIPGLGDAKSVAESRLWWEDPESRRCKG